MRAGCELIVAAQFAPGVLSDESGQTMVALDNGTALAPGDLAPDAVAFVVESGGDETADLINRACEAGCLGWESGKKAETANAASNKRAHLDAGS